MQLTTNQKGAAAEAAIVHAALELGVGVYRSFGDERADLILDLRPTLLRVQCKWAPRRGDVVVIHCDSSRRTANGLVRSLYRSEEVDAFAVYCAATGACYFIPFELVPPGGALQLRLTPSRNNQQTGIRWAKDYEFAATLRAHGAIAQLGERLHGMQEVAGSSPAGSIMKAASREAALF
jgi:hypothetical protein